MLRISKTTNLETGQILDLAGTYFKSNGLEETDRTPCCIFFEGVGGYVSVTLMDENNQRVVDVETREWEYQAQKFLGKL